MIDANISWILSVPYSRMNQQLNFSRYELDWRDNER